MTPWARRRRRFLEEIDLDGFFHVLFDDLPDVCFFAKDVQGHHLAANRTLLERYGMRRESEIIGKTDHELLPRTLANKYRADDRTVMATRRPMPGIVELFLDPQGVPSWHLAHKRPLFSRNGKVLGIMGISRQDDARSRRGIAGGRLRDVCEQLRRRCEEPLRIAALARRCKLSVRQFQRRFRDQLWMSPRAFLMRMRIERACEELRGSDATPLDVALSCGFYDQSAFARHFKALLGLTPGQYRRRFWGEARP